MLEILTKLDTEVFLFLHSIHTPWLDGFMMAFSGRFVWIPLYMALTVLIYKTFGNRLGLLFIAAIGVAITLSDQTCATVIRPIVERLRPSNTLNPLSEFVTVVDGYRGGSYGFPSCHAANSFALATFVSLLLRRKRLSWFMFIWATLNSYSRIYLGVHYPGDLIAGAVIGSTFAAACYYAASRVDSSARRRSLMDMGKPLFYITALPAGSNDMGTGITRGDLLIFVAAAIVIAITVAATFRNLA